MAVSVRVNITTALLTDRGCCRDERGDTGVPRPLSCRPCPTSARIGAGLRMYFYRIRALKRQLIAARLTDSQAVRYLVANSAATALAMALPPGDWSTWDTVFGLAGVALTALGTAWVYRQNGGHRGRHFLSRYMAVSWVVGARFVTAVLVVLVLVMVTVSLPAPVA